MDYLTQLDSTQIHFIRSHEQVYNYLSPEKKYTITNIDHHHDMGYSKKELKPLGINMDEIFFEVAN